MTDPRAWLLGAMWLGWAAYWWASASNVKPALRREGFVSALVLLAFMRKIRLEERWMQERFGDAYRRYRQRVPALVPGLRA